MILSPTAVLAKDAQAAAIGAVMDQKLEVDLNRCEVMIRPFM